MESYCSSDDEIVWETLNMQEIKTTRVFTKGLQLFRVRSGCSLPSSSSTSNTDNTVVSDENFDVPGPSSYLPPDPSEYEFEFQEFFEAEREAALNLSNFGHNSEETVIIISSDEEDSRDPTQQISVRESCTKKNDDVIVISDDSSDNCMTDPEQLAQMDSGKQQKSANNGNNNNNSTNPLAEG
ncbi:hypothetical protein MTP99_019197 [Tenebrio molitor]|nr:hypothetical protein MTP99_019197 [Tenebrio molitor]